MFEFTTPEELIDRITNDSLLATIASSTASVTLQGTTTNNHDCFIKFTALSDRLLVQGDLLGDNTLLSPALELLFTPDETNKIWLPTDADSGAIAIRNKWTYSGGISFGFLERFDPNDANAWMVAKINNRLNDAMVARSKHDSSIWRRIGDDFQDADNFVSIALNGAYQGILDYAVVVNAYLSYLNTNIRNAGYNAHLGQVNALDDRPIITRRFYLEGRGGIDNYASNGDNPLKLYNRGFVKHVVNGFGKLAPGQTELDIEGNRYLSVGGDGWQAIQTVRSSQVAVRSSNPVIFRSETGINFVTANNLIVELRNTLLNAGWTITAENSDRILFRGQLGETENYCYLRIAISSGALIVQGDILGDESKLSDPITLSFTEGTTNKIWETISQQAGAVSIAAPSANAVQGSNGLWFGFLRNISQDAPSVWGLGQISSLPEDTQVVIDGQWRKIKDFYSVNLDQRSSFPTVNFDRLTTAAMPNEFFDNSANNNSAYKAYNGQVNGATNEPQLDFYGIIDGRGSAIAYGLSANGEGNAPKQAFYGTVDFLAVGLGSLAEGETATTATGAKYLSFGGAGHQGMRIG